MKLSIRWQLVAIICAVIVVSFAALLATVKYVLMDDYVQKLRDNDIQLTYVISRDISQSLETAFAIERAAAAYPYILSMSENDQRILLQKIKEGENSFELLAIIDTDGNQLARSLGKNANRSTRPWFRKFKETEKDVISAPYYSSYSQNLIITLIHGIYEKGHATGMLMADMDTTSIQEFIKSYNKNSECDIYLLDQNGNSISQPETMGEGIFNYRTMERLNPVREDSGQMVRNSNGDPIIEKQTFSIPSGLLHVMNEAMAGKAGSTVYDDEKGNRYLAVYRTVNLPHVDDNWTLVMSRPYSSLEGAIRHLVNRAAMGSLLVAMLAIAGVIFFSKYITRPIFEIVNMAKRVQTGDLSGEIPNSRGDEIGILVDTINRMVKGLRTIEQKNREAEAKIRDMAYKDALTGLPNRTHFMIYARDMLHKSLRKRRFGAVMFVDVDKFKFVNDTFGHAVGDGLLIGFGRRLVEIIGNQKLVCRFGGDEFILFMPEANEETVVEIAEAIVNKMREPFNISGSEFHISASIGIAHYPKDATTIDELLQLADTALYASKRNGRNQYTVYKDGMTVE